MCCAAHIIWAHITAHLSKWNPTWNELKMMWNTWSKQSCFSHTRLLLPESILRLLSAFKAGQAATGQALLILTEFSLQFSWTITDRLADVKRQRKRQKKSQRDGSWWWGLCFITIAPQITFYLTASWALVWALQRANRTKRLGCLTHPSGGWCHQMVM